MIRAEYSAETDSLSRRLRDDGYALTPPTVAPDVLDALASVLTPLLQAEGERGGVRHLLDLPSVQDLARSHPVRIVAEAGVQSSTKRRSSRAKSRGADADQPDLIAAK